MTRVLLLGLIAVTLGCHIHYEGEPNSADDESGFDAQRKAACADAHSVATCSKLSEEYGAKSYFCQKATSVERTKMAPDCDTVARRLATLRAINSRLGALAQNSAEETARQEEHAQDERAKVAKEAQEVHRLEVLKSQRAALSLSDDDPSMDDIRKMPLHLAPRYNALGDRSDSHSDKEIVAAYHASQVDAAEAVTACAATKSSGFPPGTYTGNASQQVRPRNGGTVSGWKSLSIVVDGNGCTTWRGFDRGDISMPGDENRNIEKINPTCIFEGDASIMKAGASFKLAARVRSRASGPMPSQFHIWKCPGGNVQTDMSVDLRAKGCLAMGNAADPGSERGAEIVCQNSRPFDELKDRTITVQPDGSIRMPLTIVEKSTLILRKVDSKQ